jgi:hypothetical protein
MLEDIEHFQRVMHWPSKTLAEISIKLKIIALIKIRFEFEKTAFDDFFLIQ